MVARTVDEKDASKETPMVVLSAVCSDYVLVALMG
jgi:hypothetical protein